MRNSIIFLTIILITACSGNNQKTSQFRGPDRNGIYDEKNLASVWPDDSLKAVFYVEDLGKGYGPPVIWKDQLFVTGTIDSTAVLFCFDLDGKQLWNKKLGKEWVVNYPGSRSSPTIKAGLIYVGTGMGNLFCVKAKTQEIVWQKSLDQDFQGILPLFGHSESPYIYKNMIFWTAGGEKYNVVALDRFNGELIWTMSGFKERSAYHPPRVITTKNGKEILITFSAYHLMGIDISNGELLWSHEQDNFAPEMRKFGYGDTHANSVLFENNFIYYAEGDGNCGVKLKISDDDLSISEVWRNKLFDSFMGGIVMRGDYLYGGGTKRPNLYSLNKLTGVLSDSLKIGRGSVVSADNKLYYYNQKGEINLVEFEEGKLNLVSTFRIKKGSQEHFSHPLVYDGIMYIRRGNAIMGFKI